MIYLLFHYDFTENSIAFVFGKVRRDVGILIGSSFQKCAMCQKKKSLSSYR